MSRLPDTSRLSVECSIVYKDNSRSRIGLISPEGDTVIPISQMGRLRARGVKEHGQAMRCVTDLGVQSPEFSTPWAKSEA